MKSILFVFLLLIYSSVALSAGYKWELGGEGLYNSRNGVDTNVPTRILGEVGITGLNTCSKFDPKANVKLMFEGLEESLATLEDIPNQLVASLPGYIICRAKPGLCQLLQDYTARLERQFDIHVKSCESIMQSAKSGENPYAGWIVLSEAEAWKNSAKEKKSTAQTYKRVAHQRGEGITWVGGKRAGGKNQRQIQPLRHIAGAGWCIAQGRKPDCRHGDETSVYAQVWESPAAFKAWSVAILGDLGLWVYENAPPPESITGYGLEPVVRLQEERVAERLASVLKKSRSAITESDLVMLSTRDSQMTIKLLETLENDAERHWLEPNLANRIALGQVIDRALLAKRLLYAGQQEPHVQKSDAARTFIAQAMRRLEDEINMLLYDVHVRNQLLGDYGEFILGSRRRPDMPRRQLTPFEVRSVK